MNTSVTPATKDLLAEILSEFGKAPPKARTPATPKGPKKLSDDEICNSLAERFNLQKTGYKVWTAVAKIVVFQHRVCSTCGERHLEWVDEMYKFDNGRVHGTWLRHEAYGIEHPEELPIEHEILPEDRQIAACSSCIKDSNVSLILALAMSNAHAQKELPL